MGYFNYVNILFRTGCEFPELNGAKFPIQVRTAGQMLPAGSIPILIVNENKKQIVEILNEVSYERTEITALFPESINYRVVKI
jgi:hypothetical protein